MKISEVTIDDIANYLRLDEPTDIERKEIEQMKASAVVYIREYTGLEDEQLDGYDDLVTALYLLVSDMFDNRNMYIEKKSSSVNKAVESILGLHSINLL